jgi:hypothetical protein
MLVYIAGPYEGTLYAQPSASMHLTRAERELIIVQNVKAAMRVADMVIQLGCVPFIPHLWHEMNKQCPHARELWLKLGLQALPHCAAVVYIAGVSEGLDRELVTAALHNIPTFDSTNLLRFADFVREQKGEPYVRTPQKVPVGTAQVPGPVYLQWLKKEERFKRFVREL